MRGDQYYNMGYSTEDEDEDMDPNDLSGFIGNTAPPILEKPKVKARPRSAPTSTAGQATAQAPPASNLGYVIPLDDSSPYAPLNPLYAHDEAIPNPKFVAYVKTIGAAGTALTIPFMLGRGRGQMGTPNQMRVLTVFGAMYAIPVLGWQHGVTAALTKYPRLVNSAIHSAVLLGYLGYRKYTK